VSDAATKTKAQLDAEFSELYRTHLRDVYSYAYYRVGNHYDAEDLTEQTFLQAYRHFERALRESRGRPLRPWLIRIAHNLAANLYRDRSRRPSSPLEDTASLPAVHATEDLAEGRDELGRVLAAVRELPEDRREALIMRFALDMDNREIARALDRSDGATKVLIHRAIRQLESIVSEKGAPRERPAPGAARAGIDAGADGSAQESASLAAGNGDGRAAADAKPSLAARARARRIRARRASVAEVEDE
jgi:RNA polymerase sigma-70 factor (ECF subfamily)